MNIPYTGSGVLASALAMHKLYSKQAFVSAGILTAPFHHFRRGERVSLSQLSFGLPLVVKPVQEGSSVGISIVKEEGQLAAAECPIPINGADANSVYPETDARSFRKPSKVSHAPSVKSNP